MSARIRLAGNSPKLSMASTQVNIYHDDQLSLTSTATPVKTVILEHKGTNSFLKTECAKQSSRNDMKYASARMPVDFVKRPLLTLKRASSFATMQAVSLASQTRLPLSELKQSKYSAINSLIPVSKSKVTKDLFIQSSVSNLKVSTSSSDIAGTAEKIKIEEKDTNDASVEKLILRPPNASRFTLLTPEVIENFEKNTEHGQERTISFLPLTPSQTDNPCDVFLLPIPDESRCNCLKTDEISEAEDSGYNASMESVADECETHNNFNDLHVQTLHATNDLSLSINIGLGLLIPLFSMALLGFLYAIAFTFRFHGLTNDYSNAGMSD
ncbi:hypothetical protein V1514DRAFT_330818 [Lipomyces japonicus]|uniref:uncharacterized protein n=1 Tax=Lipomyces japonicus TaxID=56871 RepID=UPI0034CD2E16